MHVGCGSSGADEDSGCRRFTTPWRKGSAARSSSASPLQRPLSFAVRTTVAALLALTAAQLLGIHHPWWAAMTVWLVAQPTRGLLLERSLARLIGTTCGAIAGAAILTASAQHPVPALAALALWLALCAGAGTTVRHFRNYCVVLAGYTAAIVVLFGLRDGHADAALAWDRVLCTLIGILCSALLSFRALPAQDVCVRTQARGLLARVLRRTASRPGGGPDADAALVAEIGAFGRSIDEQSAGTIRRRLDSLGLRHISGLLLEMIALARSGNGGLAPGATCPDDPLPCARQLARAATARGQPALAGALEDLASALTPGTGSAWRHFRFDVDAVAVLRAAARPLLALAIAALLWLTTGWQAGAMMVMTAVLFTSLFSSHDHGSLMVVQVLLGTLAGAAAGLLARLVLLPQADGLPETLICIAPFLLASAWLMRQPPTAKMAIDVAMTFLLTAQPGSAPVPVEVALPEAAAIVLGVAIAVALFWLILPSTPAVNRGLLARRVARLTHRIAANDEQPALRSRHEALRRTQLRLLDVTDADGPLFGAAQACLAAAAEVRSRNSKSARETALRASAALDALITSSTRKNSNV